MGAKNKEVLTKKRQNQLASPNPAMEQVGCDFWGAFYLAKISGSTGWNANGMRCSSRIFSGTDGQPSEVLHFSRFNWSEQKHCVPFA